MNFDPNIKARLVYDGGDKVFIPPEMGTPREDQMQGTVHEQLSELCGRVCYDSLGSGRNSGDYHEHLLEVKHGSVYEHPHLTVEIVDRKSDYQMETLISLLNRPSLVVIPTNDGALYHTRVTFNYRHLLDWDRWTERNVGKAMYNKDKYTHDALLATAYTRSPAIVDHIPFKTKTSARFGDAVEPKYDTEKWITLFLSGSRGFSHEQVRHRFNISQRSTRYVDESESPWVEHPLISKYLQDETVPAENRSHLDGQAGTLIGSARAMYDVTVETLQPYLISKGVDKFTARKQARGAARGYLGNALLTEMMFSASVADWKDMLRQRYSNPADAEIRVLYSQCLPALKESRYANSFAEFEIEDAKDGIGTVLKECSHGK